MHSNVFATAALDWACSSPRFLCMRGSKSPRAVQHENRYRTTMGKQSISILPMHHVMFSGERSTVKMESRTTAVGGDASWPPGDPPPFQLPRPPTPSRRQIKEAYFPVNTNQKLQHPEIQYAWTAEDDEMVEQIKIWRQRYVKVIVPKNAHDAGTLGHWLSDMRRRKSRGQLDIDSIRKLEEAGVEWKVSVLDAKWFSNFHAARECKEALQEEDTSSSLEEVLTPEYSNQNRPDWVEASRWL